MVNSDSSVQPITSYFVRAVLKASDRLESTTLAQAAEPDKPAELKGFHSNIWFWESVSYKRSTGWPQNHSSREQLLSGELFAYYDVGAPISHRVIDF